MRAWTLPLNQIIAVIAFDSYLLSLTLFRMGFFGAAHECGEWEEEGGKKDPPL